MKRLAVIPARGGSKRIPRKNIRDFCGKPMIAHILDAARASDLFDIIHVSTDDLDIARVAGELGFAPEFMRPAELADDHTAVMAVLKYVAAEYEKRGILFDQVWLLMACAPLTLPRDLVGANQLFVQAGGASPVLGILEYPVPIEWAFRRETGGRLIPIQPGKFTVRSQDLEKRYFDSGSFAVFAGAHVRASQETGSDSGFVGYPLRKGTAIDIDDEHDWLLAEAIFRFQRVQHGN
jgi:N-acylneuraminate cytidylyltransferase